MTEIQRRVLELADSLGADPQQVAHAVKLMRSGRCDLLVEVCAARLTIRRHWHKRTRAAAPRKHNGGHDGQH
jgi:hypothetical protein